MSSDTPRKQSEQIFTAADQLLLIQLMTRKAIAARDESLNEEEESSEDQPSLAQATSPPDRWRLLPNELKLHAWQKECLPIWLASRRGTVKVATGGGKTLFALAAAQALQAEVPDLRLVIVVPTIPLMFQWQDEIRQGNLPESAISLMGGGAVTRTGPEVRVLICVLNSARERLKSFLSSAGWTSNVMLVVDECHRANAEQARRIFEANVQFALGLSATPEQDSEAEDLPTDEAYAAGPVGQGLGPIIYDFTLKQSYDAGLLTPFEVWHVGVPLSDEESAQHQRMSREISDLRKKLQARHQGSRSRLGLLPWAQSLISRGGAGADDAVRFIGLSNSRKRLLYRAQSRIELTLEALSSSDDDSESRAIVFHESIEEIEDIFLRALNRGFPAVLEHSKLPDSLRAEGIDAFRRGIARMIISAKSLVEGFNVPSADLGIIAASSGSIRQRIQSLGRMLRKKASGRTARILILYVSGSEDEYIYEKADWESVIGAERNKYFKYQPQPLGTTWTDSLIEVPEPPRPYLPPCSEIDASALVRGGAYPARADGIALKVDQSDNLRTEDGRIVPAGKDLIAEILALNTVRRAVRTPCGHLITRADGPSAAKADWRFIGLVGEPLEASSELVIHLRVKSSSGRIVLAKPDPDNRNVEHFALSTENGASHEADDARRLLLAWIAVFEKEANVKARDLYWDNGTNYWLEVGGQRIPYEGSIGRLAFRK